MRKWISSGQIKVVCTAIKTRPNSWFRKVPVIELENLTIGLRDILIYEKKRRMKRRKIFGEGKLVVTPTN